MPNLGIRTTGKYFLILMSKWVLNSGIIEGFRNEVWYVYSGLVIIQMLQSVVPCFQWLDYLERN